MRLELEFSDTETSILAVFYLGLVGSVRESAFQRLPTSQAVLGRLVVYLLAKVPTAAAGRP
jgi:hypothetical protein